MSPQAPADSEEPPSRGTRKRATILDAARDAFFEHGFVGTSMDQVAAKASVSKQTVYKHFADKEALFREVVTNVVRARDNGIAPTFLAAGEGSFEERLRSFARFFLKGVMQPDVLQLRRLVIGEVGRFPELGQAFFDLGPKRAVAQLAVALRGSAPQLGVSFDDADLAAEQLLWLVLSIPLNEAMLLGDGHRFTDTQLDGYADDGIATFLRAYRVSDG